MSAKRATSSSWKNKPMTSQNKVLPYVRRYTAAELAKIQAGFVPEVMEDKWFLYYEDQCLYCHRSWTGICIFVVEFEEEADGGQSLRVQVNRNPVECKQTDDAEDIATIDYLIQRLLLKKEMLPEETGYDANNVLKQWSTFGKALLDNDKQ